MHVKFQKYTGQSGDFFKILPEDWQENLLHIWIKESTSAEIFVLIEADKIIAGGIVFKGVTDDMYPFKEEGKTFVNFGYYYIGYVWVIESRRGENLGSLWLTSLKEYYPKANFWLAIEDEKLKKFYLKNEFQLLKENEDKENPEWLFVFETHKNLEG